MTVSSSISSCIIIYSCALCVDIYIENFTPFSSNAKFETVHAKIPSHCIVALQYQDSYELHMIYRYLILENPIRCRMRQIFSLNLLTPPHTRRSLQGNRLAKTTPARSAYADESVGFSITRTRRRQNKKKINQQHHLYTKRRRNIIIEGIEESIQYVGLFATQCPGEFNCRTWVYVLAATQR